MGKGFTVPHILVAENATASFDAKKNTVTVTHVSEWKNGGKPLIIPVGALAAVEWEKEPRRGQVKVRELRLVFRHDVRIPKKMDVGVMRAATSSDNVDFVDALRLAVVEATPKPEWQQPIDSDRWNKVQSGQRKRKIGAIVALVLVLVVALGVGVYYTKENAGASRQAGVLLEQMDPAGKEQLFHNYMVTIGIKGEAADERAAAETVCQQFDKGASFTQVGIALLALDNGMTSQQKGKFIGASVSWWCPEHRDKLGE